jgi:hypothetical protein
MAVRTIPNSGPGQRVATALTPSKLSVQVLSAAGVFVRIANRKEDLEVPLPFQGNQGMTFDATAGVVELQWFGEVWMLGVSTNASQPTVDVRMTPN